MEIKSKKQLRKEKVKKYLSLWLLFLKEKQIAGMDTEKLRINIDPLFREFCKINDIDKPQYKSLQDNIWVKFRNILIVEYRNFHKEL